MSVDHFPIIDLMPVSPSIILSRCLFLCPFLCPSLYSSPVTSFPYPISQQRLLLTPLHPRTAHESPVLHGSPDKLLSASINRTRCGPSGVRSSKADSDIGKLHQVRYRKDNLMQC